MSALREAAQQALEACEQRLPLVGQATIIDELNALRAALAQQAEPVEPVEPVAWVASKDGRVIYDDASKDDSLLRVSGDFENDEQRISYAKQIVDKLNAAPAQQAEPVKQVKTCAWRANLDAIYETECGNLHIVNDGTLEENGMKYCCYCGKEIEDESPT